MRVLPVLLVVVAAACGASGANQAAPPSATGASPSDGGGPDGAWLLTAGRTASGALTVFADRPVTLVIDGDQVSGSAACNTYGGTAQIGSGSIRFGGLFATEMACEQPVMKLERDVFDAFAVIDTFSVETTTLTLSGPDTELVFAGEETSG